MTGVPRPMLARRMRGGNDSMSILPRLAWTFRRSSVPRPDPYRVAPSQSKPRPLRRP
ncbi:hypothetical protein GCM10010363_40780 [Streptomyces omiyaensis]|nr:hypothetical protein GCM10010363_40780 [Streptomyces omiyaensis]